MEALDKYTINLIKKTALLSTVVTCVGASIMYFFGQQAIELTFIAGIVCTLMLLMLASIYKWPENPYNGLLLILTITAVIMLPTTFSGGVNSRFSVLIPIVPTMMCLVLSKRWAIALTLAIGTYVMLGTLIVDNIPDYTNGGHIQQEMFGKTLWLIMALFMALAFGLVFVDINSKLTMKLQTSESMRASSGLFDKQSVVDFTQNRLLQLTVNKSDTQFVSLLLLEAVAESQTLADLPQNELILKVARAANKVMKQDTDMLGKLSEHQLLMCVLVPSRAQALARAKQLLTLLHGKVNGKELPIDINVGIITVDKSVGVDVYSLISIADIVLRKSKLKGLNTIIDYADLKKS